MSDNEGLCAMQHHLQLKNSASPERLKPPATGSWLLLIGDIHGVCTV